jgi:hypothetical protein
MAGRSFIFDKTNRNTKNNNGRATTLRVVFTERNGIVNNCKCTGFRIETKYWDERAARRRRHSSRFQSTGLTVLEYFVAYAALVFKGTVSQAGFGFGPK